GARLQRRAHRGLRRELPARQVDEGAAAEIDRHREAAGAAEVHEPLERYARRESGDGVVARMHLEEQRRARAERLRIVLEVRAIGGPYLAELRAGAAHDVGQAEGAADLDQLAARDQHFAPARQRAQHQQYRRRVVVDDRGGFRPGELAEERLDQAIALAALAASDVGL